MIEEGSFLFEEGLEIFLAETLGETFADHVPRKHVDINQAQTSNGDIDDQKDLFVDGRLVGCSVADGIDAASCRIEIIDELTEDDTEEREWDTGRKGGDETDGEEEIIEGGGFCVKKEAEPLC